MARYSVGYGVFGTVLTADGRTLYANDEAAIVGIAVVENHPDPRYQRRGVMTGIVQVIGNAIFGLVVGALCGAWAPLH